MTDSSITRTDGKLREVTLSSHALCKQMRVHLYLPPMYGEFNMRYPVVYLLHPWGADERYWTDHLRLRETANHLINAQAIPPFIGVMPQGDKSFFVNAADPGGDFSMLLSFDPDHFAGALEGFGDYADYLLDDVIPFVERSFDARTDRAGRVVAGVGMGAFGAAALAFEHPGGFSAVGIHSPTLFTPERVGLPWIFGLGDEAAFARRDPSHLARSFTPDGLRIYLDAGYDDDCFMDVANLHYTLIERDIPHTYATRTGIQGEAYWRENLGEYLGFYAAGW